MIITDLLPTEDGLMHFVAVGLDIITLFKGDYGLKKEAVVLLIIGGVLCV